jgi:hypothetical protein
VCCAQSRAACLLRNQRTKLDYGFRDFGEANYSLLTPSEEPGERFNEADFHKHIDQIANYVAEWPLNIIRSGFFMKCATYAWGSTRSSQRDLTLPRQMHPNWIEFVNEPILIGGLYPEDGRMAERTLTTTCFCAAPRRQLSRHTTAGEACVMLI